MDLVSLSDDAVTAAAAIAVRRQQDRNTAERKSTPSHQAVQDATEWPDERVAAAIKELSDSGVMVKTHSGEDSLWTSQAFLSSVTPDPRYIAARARFKQTAASST